MLQAFRIQNKTHIIEYHIQNSWPLTASNGYLSVVCRTLQYALLVCIGVATNASRTFLDNTYRTVGEKLFQGFKAAAKAVPWPLKQLDRKTQVEEHGESMKKIKIIFRS
jgi:hypothetical protein